MQLDTDLREKLESNAKTFKTSWIFLGQALFTVWRDKLYLSWGYEKFEDYTAKELGMKKQLGMKLVKTYFFVEQQEPEYLKKEFTADREVAVIPNYEPLDILRKARSNKKITKQDYADLREKVFVKGKYAVELRKDLTAIIKERKQVDPDQEREDRHQKSIKKFISSLQSFNADMDTLQLIEFPILQEAKSLLKSLQENYG